MANRITLDELKSYLWQSAVLLRTNIDAGAYKQYIFPLMFFKRICDVYDEETENAIEKYGDDIDIFPEYELHKFVIPKGYHWKDVRQVTENIGAAIVTAFRSIEKANDELPIRLQKKDAPKMAGIFGDGAWTNKNRLPDRLLRDLLEHFSSRNLSLENCPEDELGQGYEHLKDQGKEWRNLQVYGQEINQLTSAIGRMNLFLHGIEDFHIVNDDTLKNPAFIENGQLKQFDLVLANPPYSIKQWDRSAFENDKYGRNFLGTPPQGRADYAFFQHILKSLKPDTGRCAILFPHGVLFRNEEKDMREKLVKSDLVECVIGLGANLFFNSPMEACIVICRTNKPLARRGRILMINAVAEVTRKNAQSYLEDDHIEHIATAYHDFKDEEGFSKVVTIEDVGTQSFSLSIPLYVRSAGTTEPVKSLDESINDWLSQRNDLAASLKALTDLMGRAGDEIG